MKIIGLGMDIVETARIAKSLERFGESFLRRVFLAEEIAFAQSRKFPHQHLAARFAAKEATSKAFGTGIGTQIGWLDLEITREEGEAPKIVLHGAAEILAKKMGITSFLVSLSHTEHYGAASVVAVGDSSENQR